MQGVGRATAAFLILLALYNANLRQVSSLDTYASRFVPIAVLRHGELTLDRFFPELADRPRDAYLSTYLYRRDGRLFDSHPPVGSLLAVPVYALPVWLGMPAETETAANLWSKVSASIAMALAGLVLAAMLRRYVAAQSLPPTIRSETVVVVATVAICLGTSVWSTASQALWTHTPAVLGYAVALWGLVAGRPGLAGAAAGLATVARPATLPAAAALAVFVLHRALATRTGSPMTALRSVVAFGGPLAAVGLGGIAYNLAVFGEAGGGAAGRTANWVAYFDVPHMLAGSWSEGLAGLLVSPSRGLLVYSPVLVLAGVGAWTVWSRRPSTSATLGAREAWLLARYVSIGLVGTLLLYAVYVVWWAGHAYGPRYLTDVMPLAGLLLAQGLLHLGTLSSRRRLVLRGGVAVALVYSIGVQALGAFCWPSPWTLDTRIPVTERLWDWREPQIVACLQAGPRVDPMARRLLGW